MGCVSWCCWGYGLGLGDGRRCSVVEVGGFVVLCGGVVRVKCCW
jgi:hypothetical protein